jgi:hypothetical protein
VLLTLLLSSERPIKFVLLKSNETLIGSPSVIHSLRFVLLPVVRNAKKGI